MTPMDRATQVEIQLANLWTIRREAEYDRTAMDLPAKFARDDRFSNAFNFIITELHLDGALILEVVREIRELGTVVR